MSYATTLEPPAASAFSASATVGCDAVGDGARDERRHASADPTLEATGRAERFLSAMAAQGRKRQRGEPLRPLHARVRTT